MEAMGIEPMSALHQTPSTTCLFAAITGGSRQRLRLIRQLCWYTAQVTNIIEPTLMVLSFYYELVGLIDTIN